MKHDDFLQVVRSPFHFATCDAVLRGCKIVDISKPPQRLRLSKNLPLRGGQGVNAPFSTVCATAAAGHIATGDVRYETNFDH